MGKKEKIQKEKPLEKMTAKDLRELAKELGDIQGAHGMNKEELLAAIRRSKGIEESKAPKVSMREIKAKVRQFRSRAAEAKGSGDRRMYKIFKKKAVSLKKRTRRGA